MLSSNKSLWKSKNVDKPKRFLECLIPVSICNLECPYCYIIQEDRRNMKLADMKYSPSHIARALSPERLGGISWISICGAGETLMQKEVVDIVKLLLKEGHYINITTNGTITKRFEELIAACGTDIERLHISFSLHYTELKKNNLLQVFCSNVKLMKQSGASILVQLNLCDEYIPYIEEIQQLCMDNFGAYPQIALTRDESTRPMKIFTTLSETEYVNQGNKFNSPLFDFTYHNFNVRRNEFCYAGEWSGVLNLQTGWLSKCYANDEGQDIFADINTPIKFDAVGWGCNHCYCVNSSHFMSLGVIPKLNTPTYGELRNRKQANWYSVKMEQFLNHKLEESNKKYSIFRIIRMAWKQSERENNRVKSTIRYVISVLN